MLLNVIMLTRKTKHLGNNMQSLEVGLFDFHTLFWYNNNTIVWELHVKMDHNNKLQ